MELRPVFRLHPTPARAQPIAPWTLSQRPALPRLVARAAARRTVTSTHREPPIPPASMGVPLGTPGLKALPALQEPPILPLPPVPPPPSAASQAPKVVQVPRPQVPLVRIRPRALAVAQAAKVRVPIPRGPMGPERQAEPLVPAAPEGVVIPAVPEGRNRFVVGLRQWRFANLHL